MVAVENELNIPKEELEGVGGWLFLCLVPTSSPHLVIQTKHCSVQPEYWE